MDRSKTTIERAFELARSGAVSDVTRLRARLKGEGYPEYHVVGRALVTQLRQIMVASRIK